MPLEFTHQIQAKILRLGHTPDRSQYREFLEMQHVMFECFKVLLESNILKLYQNRIFGCFV